MGEPGGARVRGGPDRGRGRRSGRGARARGRPGAAGQPGGGAAGPGRAPAGRGRSGPGAGRRGSEPIPSRCTCGRQPLRPRGRGGRGGGLAEPASRRARRRRRVAARRERSRRGPGRRPAGGRRERRLRRRGPVRPERADLVRPCRCPARAKGVAVVTVGERPVGFCVLRRWCRSPSAAAPMSFWSVGLRSASWTAVRDATWVMRGSVSRAASRRWPGSSAVPAGPEFAAYVLVPGSAGTARARRGSGPAGPHASVSWRPVGDHALVIGLVVPAGRAGLGRGPLVHHDGGPSPCRPRSTPRGVNRPATGSGAADRDRRSVPEDDRHLAVPDDAGEQHRRACPALGVGEAVGKPGDAAARLVVELRRGLRRSGSGRPARPARPPVGLPAHQATLRGAVHEPGQAGPGEAETSCRAPASRTAAASGSHINWPCW